MEPSEGVIQRLDGLFSGWVVAPLEAVIFFDVAFWSPDVQIPLVVLWLILGATFFTLRFRFINLRGFHHAIDAVRGVYSRPDETGEVSHFQALSAALSATVGLGNIAGVAVAVAGILFILALRGLSSPATSRTGNRLGMIGMAVAVVTTLVTHDIANIVEILIAIVVLVFIITVAATIRIRNKNN